MDAYLLGCEPDVGALVISPADMLDEMNTVDAAVRQLSAVIAVSTVGQAFKQAFAAFATEWSTFYAAHAGWAQRLWSATYEKTLEYRQRTEEWRVAFAREGGNPMMPPLAPPAGPKPSGGGHPVYWLVGAGLAAWAFSSVASVAKSARRP
jgi:hypothetical protein